MRISGQPSPLRPNKESLLSVSRRMGKELPAAHTGFLLSSRPLPLQLGGAQDDVVK